MPKQGIEGSSQKPEAKAIAVVAATSAAAKSLQSCPTLCDPIDGSPPGSLIPGILQGRTLGWVAISFSNAWKWKVKVKSLSHVWLLATPWTAAWVLRPWDLSGKNTGVGCHCLLQDLSLGKVKFLNHIPNKIWLVIFLFGFFFVCFFTCHELQFSLGKRERRQEWTPQSINAIKYQYGLSPFFPCHSSINKTNNSHFL